MQLIDKNGSFKKEISMKQDDNIYCPIPSLKDIKARIVFDIQTTKGLESSWGIETTEVILFECPVSGLRFRKPIHTEQVKQFYNAEYHDRMLGEDDDDRRTKLSKKENLVRIQLLKKYCSQGRVLDVGCSKGILGQQLHKAGYEVYACDISESACNEARKLLGEERVFHSSVSELPLSFKHKFDVVTLMDVIEHFQNVVEPLETIREILKPGGVLFIRTPTLNSLFFRLADLSYLMTFGKFKNAIFKIYHAEHFYFFNESNIKTLLTDCGYEVIDIQPDPSTWSNFASSELRHGIVLNIGLALVYFIGRLFHKGHGMKIIARNPI